MRSFFIKTLAWFGSAFVSGLASSLFIDYDMVKEWIISLF